MKTTIPVKAAFLLLFLALFTEPVPAQDTLPKYLSVQLKQLEETWHILDLISTEIWPGWTGYADLPFMFAYPNGVRMLVGHPKPPEGFSLVAGITPRGKTVYLDRSKEIPLPMPLPLSGGGGPIPYGIADGKSITVISINIRSSSLAEGMDTNRVSRDTYSTRSENQILIGIHELFHCFQKNLYQWKSGNLRFNTDENYATYAEIEGLALERAYLEANDDSAKEYLKDCLVAKQRKRRSMNDLERLQESDEDVMEGTATYAELMTLMLLKSGYESIITQNDDPYFYSFKDADSLAQFKLNSLRTNRASTLSSIGKSYPFGCFEAMLLTRLSPGWRNGFFQKGKGLEVELDSLLSLSLQEREAVDSRLSSRYGYDTIYARHASVIGERNKAYETVQQRTGMSYVVNFKNTGDFVSAESLQTSYRVGLINIYPTGIRRVRIADVVFEGKETPMVIDQLYYIKWIDTEAKGSESGYEVEGVREGTTDIYRDAVISTRGFRLSAPKIEIREGKNRVKMTVLSKLKQ
ncbi:MAG: hypothetical protein A3H45_14905 [Ignavibacteria bacterium RIFCSPLOWO2_02_FULL_55_14]|nr:MAG: hypothetical protein A3C56_06965 [Ignavibacteria bacterium RIFCSPHIGHO2_02_FULL_56_12]OGU70491.1 MAG: hypothetical protein A3G43_03345 [Ignavibacteria bacterium RIFCSPLOWO2_12_FULL_56_21]OGU73942.1 MAG: hypothetical protein A3H45_14905 [Ignavibacteria bacterium RIFCSPLOWO2_02_FULL_55_14]